MPHRIQAALVVLCLVLAVGVGGALIWGPPAEGPTPGTPTEASPSQSEIPSPAAGLDLTVDIRSLVQPEIQGDDSRRFLTGRLVDGAGEPIPGETIRFAREFLPVDVLHATTDSKGRFEVWAGKFTEEGDFRATIEAPHLQLTSRPILLRLPAASPRTLRGVYVRDVRGVVLDSTTRLPLEGIEITLRGNVQTSDADGRFRFEKTVGRSLNVSDPRQVYLNQTVRVLAASKGRPVTEIALDRSRVAHIRVRNSGTGRPIEAFSIRTWSVDAEGGPSEVRQPGPHPDGALAVHGLWPGINELVVIPDDPTLTDSAIVTIDPSDDTPLEIALSRRAAMRVQVVDHTGAGVQNVLVRLITMRGRSPAHAQDVANKHWRPPTKPAPTGSSLRPKVVSRDRTNGGGFATLGIPADFRNLAVSAWTREGSGPSTTSTIMWGRAKPFVTVRIPKPKSRKGSPIDRSLSPDKTTSEPDQEPPRPNKTLRLRGRVTIAGRVPNREMQLGAYIDRGQLVGLTPVDPATGAFVFDNVPHKKSVLLRIEPRDEFPRGWWNPSGRVPVQEHDREVQVRFVDRTATLQITDRVSGEPLAQQAFLAGVGGVRLVYRTDDEGIIRANGLPLEGTLEVAEYTQKRMGINSPFLRIPLKPDQPHYQEAGSIVVRRLETQQTLKTETR